MSNPWKIVNDICAKDHKISSDEIDEEYDSFLVNRSLSYFPDTVMVANLMNNSTDLTKEMQYLFYINSVTPKKRYSKWGKKRNNDMVVKVAEYYKTSLRKAEEIMSVLPESTIEKIITKGENHE